MPYKETWSRIEEFAEGAQGKTYLVTNRQSSNANLEKFGEIFESARRINPDGRSLNDRDKERFDRIGATLLDWIARAQRAVDIPKAVEKVLHMPKGEHELQKVRARFDIEVDALDKISHPNIVELIDYDRDGLSYVMKFYSGGTLSEQTEFRGQALKSLYAIRPIIEAVSELHKLDYTHRDIKPQNIFVAADGALVLGDFGLVFDASRNQGRITNSKEKIGTTDYMPSWVKREFMSDVPSSFDVYALGKVLYEMIAGKRLHLWYLTENEYFLPRLFAEKRPEMFVVHDLISKIVCEDPGKCLPDASALLIELDKVIDILRYNGQLVAEDIRRRCLVCACGTYERGDDRLFKSLSSSSEILNFVCCKCGHLQSFIQSDSD